MIYTCLVNLSDSTIVASVPKETWDSEDELLEEDHLSKQPFVPKVARIINHEIYPGKMAI